MNYRTTQLFAPADLVASSGTKVIDINVKDIISRINLYWQVTASQHGMNSYPHSDITKIELVDGSDVLHSLNGGQNQALAIYDRKCASMDYGQKTSGNSLASLFAIDFGRYLHDPLLALDPSKFRNLQLKISYNEALADTGASANELEVVAEIFDEKIPSPIGFLSASEIYNATPPSSGYTYIDLPVDRTLRKLLLQGYYKSFEPWSNLTNAKLDEDNDKRVVFDWSMERYYRMMKGVWTPVEELLVTQPGAGGSTYYLTPCDYYASVLAMPTLVQSYAYSLGGYFKGGTVVLRGDGGNVMMVGLARGYLPNHCFEFPFGDPQDIDDWYSLANVGSLRLRLKSGGANGNYGVVLQQLRRY